MTSLSIETEKIVLLNKIFFLQTCDFAFLGREGAACALESDHVKKMKYGSLPFKALLRELQFNVIVSLSFFVHG